MLSCWSLYSILIMSQYIHYDWSWVRFLCLRFFLFLSPRNDIKMETFSSWFMHLKKFPSNSYPQLYILTWQGNYKKLCHFYLYFRPSLCSHEMYGLVSQTRLDCGTGGVYSGLWKRNVLMGLVEERKTSPSSPHSNVDWETVVFVMSSQKWCFLWCCIIVYLAVTY